MDDVTFRRLAPDAVAGRLDAETQAAWREAAAATPERAALAVQIAQAEVRAAAAPVPAPEAPRRVPKQTVVVLMAVFALVGMTTGAMVMNSYLKAERPPANGPVIVQVHRPPPTPEPQPPAEPEPEPEPEPLPPPQPEPEPAPQPEPEPAHAGMVLKHSELSISMQRPGGRWEQFRAPVAVDGYVVVSEGYARFEDDGLVLSGLGRFSFERLPDRIRLVDGRHFVRCRRTQVFTLHQITISTEGAHFAARHVYWRENEIHLLAGAITVDDGRTRLEFTGPCRIQTSDMTARLLTEAELAELRRELGTPRRALMHWDCETPETSPAFGEVVNGTVRRRPGSLSVGSTPGEVLFHAVENGRLSLRVLTYYTRLHISLRVHLDDGYRTVDMIVDLPGQPGWHTIDVPLADLRAGRLGDEPGWLPGRAYSTLAISAAVKPGQAYERRELVLDDIMVYVIE